MLNKIKSTFIIKKIFIYLYDRRQLKLVKYNKKLQSKISINPYDYKIFSGRYIIYEKDGKVKEYNYNDVLIFEGEYLNGKGKEYDLNGNLVFEGEYLNGKRNGKGKEYDYNGNLEFEGVYLNGKKWSGIGYSVSGGVEYELNDGKGIVKKHFDNCQLKLEGEYLNGKLNGKIKKYYHNGTLEFEGEYLNGNRWNGKGYDLNNKISYELKNGKGFVKEYYFKSQF